MKPAPPVTKVRISAFGILARMRRAVAVLALALLAGGTCATQAPAQEDGVYFDDPDSPGGKEYSIPHERTRRENGGGGGGDDPGSRGETPRFGVGIDSGEDGSGGGGVDGSGGGDGSGGNGSGSEGSGRAGSGGGKSGGGGDAGGSGGTGSGDTAGESGSEAVPYKSSSSSSDTSPELTVSAIALGVLLAGAGLGLVLRRSRRDPSA
jgi:hypothetical protein